MSVLKKLRVDIPIWLFVFTGAFSSLSFADDKTLCESLPYYDDLDKSFSSISIYMDQDLLVSSKKNSDRDYTMGFEISIGGDWVYKAPVYCHFSYALNSINKTFLGGLSGVTDGALYIRSGSLGDIAFTPDDLSNSSPIRDDRPYANLLYASVSEHVVYEKNEHANVITSKLTVGFLGLNVGRAVQTWIHEHGSSPTPRGWDHQISDGGELTALYYRRKMRNYPTESPLGWTQPEFVTYWDYSLGYYIEAGAGARVRWGNINSPLYVHVSDPMGTGNHAATKGNDFYLFIDLNAKYNAYNALLQGQFRDSEVTYSSNEIRHLFGQVSLGVVKSWDSHSLSYVYHYRGSELESGAGDRAHYFGGLYYSYVYE